MVITNTNRYIKRILIFLVSILGLYIIVNLSFNYWLQKNLPEILQKKLPYQVHYKAIDVNLKTGSVALSDIQIKNKSHNSSQLLGVEGHVSSLRIEDLGIWNAIKNKEIDAGKIELQQPNLIFRLPQEKKDQVAHQQPLLFENVKVSGGNIKLLKNNGDSLLSVKNLELEISNFRLTEKGVKQKLPIVLDAYSISGTDFSFHTGIGYQISSEKVSSVDQQIVIENFKLLPKGDRQQMLHEFPKIKNIFNVDARKMIFKKVDLKEELLSLKKIQLVEPNILITEINPHKVVSQTKSFDLPVDLAEVEIINGKFLHMDYAGKKLLNIGSLNAKAEKIAVNDRPKRNAISYHYGNFQFTIHDAEIGYIRNLKIKVDNLSFDNSNAQITGVKLNSTNNPNSLHVDIPKISIDDYVYTPNESLDHFKVKAVKIGGVQASILSNLLKNNTQPQHSKEAHYPIDLQVEQLVLAPSYFIIKQPNGKSLLNVDRLGLILHDVIYNKQTAKSAIPFQYKEFSLGTQRINYWPNHYSELSVASLQANHHSVNIHGFSFLPTKSRKDFLSSLAVQQDLYTVKIPKIGIQQYKLNWKKNLPNIIVDRLDVDKMFMNIYSYGGNHPPKDNQPRTFFNEKLRKISLPFVIRNTYLKQSAIEYEETDDQAIAPGKLSFTDTNLQISNINSGKIYPQQSKIQVRGNTRFFNQAPTQVDWWLDVSHPKDIFGFSATIDNLDAAEINAFLKPYLHVSASGKINKVHFDFNGDKTQIHGPFSIAAKDLHVDLFNPDNTKKQGLKTLVANWVIPRSKNIPPQVEVEVIRKEKRSFFNLLWKGLEKGLQRSLVGDELPKKIEKVKKTIESVKAKSQKIKSDINNTSDRIIKKEKGLLKNLFKKKNPNNQIEK